MEQFADQAETEKEIQVIMQELQSVEQSYQTLLRKN